MPPGRRESGTGTTIVGFDRRFARKLGADLLADFVDRGALDDAVGPREIDMLENARTRFGLGEWPEAASPSSLTMISSPGSTSRRRLAPMTSSATLSEAKIVDSPSLPMTNGRMPSGSRQATRPWSVRTHQRIGAFDLAQRVGQPIERGRVAGRGDEVDDDLGIAGRLEDGATPDERAPQRHSVGKIAVMSDGEATLGQVGEQAAGRCAVPYRRSSNSGRGRSRPAGELAHDRRRGRNCRRHGPWRDGA